MKREQKGSIPQGDEKTIANPNVEQIEQDKRKAAYALNLCTVSVSQIIDYEDLNILEQEYEMILNNLNLENFPKDKPLLHILKQILDTVSFFRIYEGDKRMLDKKYQQDMKNAIWSAIPPFTFVAGGDPYALAVSAIAAVGMGYMNYRKEKAKKTFEKEEDEWKLQRSAIEQFHGLRRELFDTAWRLSEKYGFNDEYRLTEKQISAYNKILMDPLPLRKYERLKAIEKFFYAYPPYWYYLGNAALDVANIYNNSEYRDLEAISKYRSLAEENFHNFLTYDHSLLRTDYIRSSCCLEYAALLLEYNNDASHEKVKQLIAEAEKCSSDALDVLQICAMYSLRINDKDTAQRLLRKLVIEGFNTTTNAQLLSYVYLNVAIENKKLFDKKTTDYKELIQFADGIILIPWVEDVDMLNKKGINNLFVKFLDKQKERIQKKFNAVIDKIVETNAVEYNKHLFMFYNDYNVVDDSFFLESDVSKKYRKDKILGLSKNQTDWSIFVNNIRNKNIALVLDNQINEVFRLLNSLVSQTLKGYSIEEICSIDYFIDLSKKILLEISEIKNKVDSSTFDEIDCEYLLDITFTSIIEDYIDLFKSGAVSRIADLCNFNEIISIESKLAEFCKSQSYPSPEKLCEQESITCKEYTCNYVNVLNYFVGGEVIRQNAEIESKVKELLVDFEKSKKYILEDVDLNSIVFTTDRAFIVKQRDKLSKKYKDTIISYGNILACFHDNKSLLQQYIDLYFFREGLILVSDAALTLSKFSTFEYFNYNEIGYDSSKHKLMKNKEGIKGGIDISDSVNVGAIYDLIKELNRISSSKNTD